ncbi:MAG: hypothetical protein AB7N76_00515 [Planctomycetota bacterium]
MSSPRPILRAPRIALGALLLPLMLLSGCASEGPLLHPSESFAREFPLTERAYTFGFTFTGVPLAVAALPITLPLEVAIDQVCLELGPIALPAGLGVVGGIACAAAPFCLELVLLRPLRLLRRADRREPRPSAAPPPRAAPRLPTPGLEPVPLDPDQLPQPRRPRPTPTHPAPTHPAPARRPATVVEWPHPGDVPPPPTCSTCHRPLHDEVCPGCGRRLDAGQQQRLPDWVAPRRKPIRVR